jgi:hypothetical protein
LCSGHRGIQGWIPCLLGEPPGIALAARPEASEASGDAKGAQAVKERMPSPSTAWECNESSSRPAGGAGDVAAWILPTELTRTRPVASRSAQGCWSIGDAAGGSDSVVKHCRRASKASWCCKSTVWQATVLLLKIT